VGLGLFLFCSLADVFRLHLGGGSPAQQRTASSTYGLAAWHAPSCGLSGRWTVDKIRPDMLDQRALIPPLWAPHFAQKDRSKSPALGGIAQERRPARLSCSSWSRA